MFRVLETVQFIMVSSDNCCQVVLSLPKCERSRLALGPSDSDNPRRLHKDWNTSMASASQKVAATEASSAELQWHALSRIPKSVPKQLRHSEWRQVFSVAAESQKSQTTGPRSSTTTSSTFNPSWVVEIMPSVASANGKDTKDSFDDQPMVVDDTPTVISGLTIPASFVGNDDGGSDIAEVESRMNEVSLKVSSLPSRSWHEGTSTHVNAPKIPRRSGSSISERRLSAPISLSPQAPLRELRRFNTDPDVGSRHVKRGVSFSYAYVRYYERILDINPSTSSGPSVGLGWRYSEMDSIDLEDIDDIPTDTRRMVLSRPIREHIVRELGYTRAEIAQSIRQSLKLKNQRAQTYNNLRHQKVEYLVEKSKRKVGQLLRFRIGKGDFLHPQDKWEAL